MRPIPSLLISCLILVSLSATCQVTILGSSPNANSQLVQQQQNKGRKGYLLLRRRNGNLIYNHEFAVGGRLNTDGWNGFLELGKRKNNLVTTLYQFEVGEKNDPKENKTANPLSQSIFGNTYNNRPYIYGKQNIFYQIKLGIGQQRLIGGKGNKHGVEVSAIYLGGLSLGLLRPYYLEVYQDSTSTSTLYIKYTTADQNQFLDSYNIAGGTGFSKGWNEMTLVPGIHARLGLRFDWSAFNQMISALEVSMNMEYYTQKIPIMVQAKEKQFFLNASVSILFGKRW